MISQIPKFLKDHNYPNVNIIPYNKHGVEVREDDGIWRLIIDGVQQNLYQSNHSEGFQVYSHYELAYGDVICTGLGFGIREQWIASKPEVTKVMVLERSKELIEYHKAVGTIWNDKIEIIEADANQYRGNCDFLAIDHYEKIEPAELVKTIETLTNNISCKLMWFWQLENLLYGFDDKGAAYHHLLKIPGMGDLPYLPKETVLEFYEIFHGKYNQ